MGEGGGGDRGLEGYLAFHFSLDTVHVCMVMLRVLSVLVVATLLLRVEFCARCICLLMLCLIL